MPQGRVNNILCLYYINMIKNETILKEYEKSLARKEGPLPPQKAFAIFAAMWQEAMALGIIPFKEPLAGIENDIKVAGMINSCLKK